MEENTRAAPQSRTFEDRVRSVIDYLRLFLLVFLVGGSVINGFAERWGIATWLMSTAIFIRVAGVRW